MDLQSRSTIKVARQGAHNGTETHLQGVALILARIAWIVIALLSIVLFVAALPSYFAYLHIIDANSVYAHLTPGDVGELQRFGLSVDFYAWLIIGVSVIFLLVYFVIGAVIFWRKSDDRVALLASLTLVLFPIALNTQIVGTLPPAWTQPTNCVEFIGDVCFALFIYLFPSGQFVPRWTRWLMLALVAYWLNSTFFPNTPLSNSWIPTVLFFPLIATPIILQVYRYRRVSTPVQRQQTKWVIFGLALAFGSFVIGGTLLFIALPRFFYISPMAYALWQIPLSFLLLLFPLSMAFAILRNRLWEIDRLINRALVYGSLTILLGLLYAGLIIGLQALLGGFTRQTNSVIIVASTLAIYALFHPLRRRIQRVIDRRFYRSKYDAHRTLEQFSTALRNEVDLSQLSEQLVSVVEETMQPAHVSLWLRPSVGSSKSVVADREGAGG